MTYVQFDAFTKTKLSLVDCMGDRRGAYRNLVETFKGEKPLERPRRR